MDRATHRNELVQQKDLRLMFKNLLEFWHANGRLPRRPASMEEYARASAYSRNPQERIREINENLSQMLIDSSKEIDRICSRVKQCLSQMKEVNKSTISAATTDVSVIESLNEEVPEKDATRIPESEDQKVLSPFFTIISKSRDQLTTQTSKIQTHAVVVCKNKLSLANFKAPLSDSNEVRHVQSKSSYEAMDKMIDDLNNDIADLSQKSALYKEAKTQKCEEPRVDPTRELSAISELSYVSQVNMDMDGFQGQYVIPEVYHRPAVTDLHTKLLKQIEANDSLIYFQKMMELTKARIKKGKKKSSKSSLKDVTTLPEKLPTPKLPSRKHSASTEFVADYKDSLWFSEGRKLRKRAPTNSRKSSSTQQFKAKVSNYSIKMDKEKKKKNCRMSGSDASMISNRSCRTIVEPKRSARNTEFHHKSRLKLSQSSKMPSGTLPGRELQSRSQSLSPLALCRFRWMKAKAELTPFRRLEFMDILDDLTERDLEPLQSEYPRKDNLGSWTRDVKETYLFRLVHGGPSFVGAWRYLLRASARCPYPSQNGDMAEIEEQDEDTDNDDDGDNDDDDDDELQIFNNCALSRTEVVKKLSSYIYDPETTFYQQTMMVMPVRVFYDNYKAQEAPTKLQPQRQTHHPPFPPKLPLVPMKEPKVVSNRAVWSSPTNVQPLTEGTSTKRSNDATRNISRDSKGLPNKTVSKSSPPKCFEPFCKHPESSTLRRQPTRIDSSFDNRATPRTSPSRDGSSASFQKKLWAYKYKKPVNQQLLNFIENQPMLLSQYKRSAAVVDGQTSDVLTDVRDRLQQMKGTREGQQVRAGEQKEKRMVEQKNVKQGVVKKTVIPHKRMLDQLKGLKQKNDVIQNNIQKAIDVIESKMVHLLSTADNTTSMEAFDCMEKEITNVLSMMKCEGQKELQNVPEKENTGLEEDFDMISEQVFTKLNRILDASRSRSSTATENSIKTSERLDKQMETEVTDQDIPLEMAVTDKSPITLFTSVPREKNEHKSKFSTIRESSRSHSSSEQSDRAVKDCCGDDVNNREEDKDKTLSVDELSDNSRGDCLSDKPDCKQSEQTKDNLLIDHALSLEVPSQSIVMGEEAIATAFKPNSFPPVSPLNILPKNEEVEASDEENSISFSEHVNKIIRRVEDIYSQLDDIQGTEQVELPRFTEEARVTEVNSDEFLTPFMQAVKDKREHPDTAKQLFQKSPSFYNVLSFLDTLTDTPEDKVSEVYYARSCSYGHLVSFPKTLRQSRISHLQKVEKPSCLKRPSEDSCRANKKRVSFLVIQEDKSSQVRECPKHATRIVSVCSEQFPPQFQIYSEKAQKTQSLCKCSEAEEDQRAVDQATQQMSTSIDNDKTTQVYHITTKNKSCFEIVNLTQKSEQDASPRDAQSQAPHVNIFYDKSDANLPKVIIKSEHDGDYDRETYLKVKNFRGRTYKVKPKVVVFRETVDLLRPLRCLQTLSDSALTVRNVKSADPVMSIVKVANKPDFRELGIAATNREDQQREVLLKSVYAIVSILMFTALNMDYRCQ